MDDERIHVAGSGSFAAEVIEFARAAGLTVMALLEPIDATRIGGQAHGLPVLDPALPPHAEAGAVVAVGADRGRIGHALEDAGWIPRSVVHPSAVVSPSAAIGRGVVIGPLAVVGAQAHVADHALLGRGALLGHHATVGAGAVLNPGANVAGMVSLGAGVTVGMSAAVANGRTIGEGAVIAAGAVVVRDVDAGDRVQGVPARRFAGGTA